MKSASKSYDEIVDLFARGTPPARIVAFHPSRESQERVRYLLSRNKIGDLTPEETAELERFGELEHLMELVKARAHPKRVEVRKALQKTGRYPGVLA